MVGKAAVGKREKEEEGGRRSGKARVADQTAGMTERGFHALKYLSVGAQNSLKKGVHFGTHRSRVSVHASHEALTLHSPVARPGSPRLTPAHPAREVRVFKAAWCG